MIRDFEQISPELDRVAMVVVDVAFKVHKSLGPGLLESVYETCMSHELKLRGLKVQTQVPVPIIYEGSLLTAPFGWICSSKIY